MKTDPNEPAAPTIEQGGDLQTWHTVSGLTKREQFSAMAMQGILSSLTPKLSPENTAKWAVKCSDALIEALNK